MGLTVSSFGSSSKEQALFSLPKIKRIDIAKNNIFMLRKFITVIKTGNWHLRYRCVFSTLSNTYDRASWKIHMIELPGMLVNGFYSLTVFTKDVYQRSKYPFSDISEGCRHASWALKSFYYTWSNIAYLMKEMYIEVMTLIWILLA